MSRIDPVDLGIMWDRLISITDEILLSTVRTAFSVGVREAWDLACVIFDAEGRSIAQATWSMPAFIGTAPMTMQHMLAKYPADRWRPGDVVVTNDPWLGTGHIPDICIARPIFARDRLTGFVMNISHLPDIGGAGLSVTNREVFEEGLMLPVCKLYDGGAAVTPVHDILTANVRVPDLVWGDINANISGCVIGERLVRELMQEYGLDDLARLSDGIITQSEAATRREIAAMPDGRYRHEVQVETVEQAVTLACSVDVAGDAVSIDFAGTGPCVDYAVNVPLCYTRAFAVYALKCITTPSMPNNQGAILPIRVSAPAGSILNAQRPMPTGGRHSVGWFIVPLIMGALAEAVPERVQADAGMASLFIMQTGGSGGEANSVQYFLAGGLGAMAGLDGHHTTPSPTNNAVVATEVWEAETGMTVNFRRLRVDSGGAGKFRGGLGQIAEMTNTAAHAVTVFMFGMRTEFAAHGFGGGRAGSLRRFELNGAPIPPKGRLVLEPGDTLTVYEAGGGGFGDPHERHPDLVLNDVLDGAVSPSAAADHYGVTVDIGTRTARRP